MLSGVESGYSNHGSMPAYMPFSSKGHSKGRHIKAPLAPRSWGRVGSAGAQSQQGHHQNRSQEKFQQGGFFECDGAGSHGQSQATGQESFGQRLETLGDTLPQGTLFQGASPEHMREIGEPLGQLFEPANFSPDQVRGKKAPLAQSSETKGKGAALPASHLNGFSALCGIISNLVEERTTYSSQDSGVQYGSEAEATSFPEEYLNEDESEPLDGDGTVYYNPGSIGHPDVCSRKCLYFASGDCSNGEACRFCHMAHPKRPPRLDRMNRELLRNMTFEERAFLVLPIIKQKVTALCLSLGPVAAVEDCIASEYPAFTDASWEEARAAVGQNRQPPQKMPKLKMLRNALKWHNARFLTMLLRDASTSPAIKAILEPLAEQMRLY
jgi:hypothetical protein